MELVNHRRRVEQHMGHLQRIRSMTPMLDTSPPESLGLKLLETRPKKQQLVEDRRREVARENAKLMTLMNDIMTEKRQQPVHIKTQSLNEPARRRQVDRVIEENRRISQRLQKIQPVINNRSLEVDFKKHRAAEAHLRRRQMKPIALPRDLNPSSTLSPMKRSMTASDWNHSQSSSGFGLANSNPDLLGNSQYVAQRAAYLRESAALDTLGLKAAPSESLEHHMDGMELHDGMISSVQDFRKAVISQKKAAHIAEQSQRRQLNNGSSTMMSAPGPGEHYPMRASGQPATSLNASHNEALFEFSYTPK